jgi:nitroreductase
MADVLANVDETVHPAMPAERREGHKQRVLSTFSNQAETAREAWGAAQSYIALGYLLLAGESLGYGTTPMLGFDAQKVREILGLPAHAAIPAIVSLGVPDEPGFAPHRHPTARIMRTV